MVNMIFFSANGLTSTSANHVANMAKEYVQSLEKELNSVCLVNSYIKLIGSSESDKLKGGWTDKAINTIPEKLNKIAQANSLIAWLREAIKAKEKWLKEVGNMDFLEWAASKGIAIPEYPKKMDTLSRETVIMGFSVKKRNRLYALEAKAAVLGKYIHPERAFSLARQEFMERMNNQNEVKANGRDTLLYQYVPSCSEEELEKVFFALQKEHRETQAELNGILHEIDEEIRQSEIQAESKFYLDVQQHDAQIREISIMFDEQRKVSLKEAGDLKIIIPNDLMEIYEFVNGLGK